MKNLYKRIVGIAFITIAYTMMSFAKGDVLLWTISDEAFVDNVTISTFVSPLPDDDDNWAVGRLKITTGNGNIKYLDLVQTDANPNNPPTYYSGAEGVWIGGGGDFQGAEWNQTVLNSDVDSLATFAIELGINHYNYNTDSIDFELLAITNPHIYEELQAFMYPIQDLNPHDCYTLDAIRIPYCSRAIIKSFAVCWNATCSAQTQSASCNMT